jgi:putative ABC transport system ATP-binding protein
VRSGIIRVHEVRKAYVTGDRRVEALRGVSFEIAEPGFYAIMGASGSGKSTLLHLLAGLDRPDTGTIDIGGAPIHSLNERDLTRYRRRGVGIVFQQFNLIPTLSALENVTLPGMFDGVAHRELQTRGEQLLDSLRIGHRAAHRPDALSGGEQQRIAIARALLFSPPVLLADEPTGNLDSASSEQLWKLLRSLAAERHMTVIMVTHEPAAAIHCQRVFVLRDGAMEGAFDVEAADPAVLAARYHQLAGQTR